MVKVTKIFVQSFGHKQTKNEHFLNAKFVSEMSDVVVVDVIVAAVVVVFVAAVVLVIIAVVVGVIVAVVAVVIVAAVVVDTSVLSS